MVLTVLLPTGDPGDVSVDSNPSILELLPPRGDTVLPQANVGVILAPGWAGEILHIGGTVVPVDQQRIEKALNSVIFRPGADLALERQLAMIQVNITSLVSLTWQLLPALRKQSGSFVINVASTAAFQAGPNMAIYYATKAFVLSFSEALHEELKGAGVAVSALCPGATASEFAQEAHMTDTKLFKAGTMTAEDVVKKSLAQRRNAIVIPGLRNLLMVWSGKLSPRAVTRRLAGWLQA